jgi:pimeloyl-ACP methyl ester carboxylesterase
VPAYRRGDVELHYETYGEGDPVVLLHGFTSTGAGWARHGWVDCLAAEGFRVIAMDMRSHGSSTRIFEPSACTTGVLAADVVGLLDHLAIPRASVFGFSMGGGVALELARTFPSRVRAAAIAGVGDAAINELHDPEEVAAIAEAFASPAPDPTAGSSAARIRRNAESAGNDLRALAPFLQNGGWPGGLESIARPDVPVLVLVAEKDEYMRIVDALSAALEPAEVVVLRGVGHHEVMPSGEAKQAVAAFLRRAAATRSS